MVMSKIKCEICCLQTLTGRFFVFGGVCVCIIIIIKRCVHKMKVLNISGHGYKL